MSRRLVWGTVALILAVSLVSGPLVPAVDLTSERSNGSYCSPSGNASVTVVSEPPERITLSKQDYGADVYRLPSTRTVVQATDVVGCPVLVYELTSEELQFVNRRLVWLTDHEDGEVSLSLVQTNFDPINVGGMTFNGTIRVKMRADVNRTVYEQNVTLDATDD